MNVYFDNAATTPLAGEVLEEMLPYLGKSYGNPSSIHAHGRQARAAVEKARKKVAGLLNTSPSEIFFTSGGTEADNMAIRSTVESYGLRQIITSPLEHHAVLHTAEAMQKSGTMLTLLRTDGQGQPDLAELESLLSKGPKSLVSLMHGNNEIGNLADIGRIGELCQAYGALFHSDTVQTMGHFPFDLQSMKVDLLVGSAHKFHGPKGIGFLYVNHKNTLQPLIYGGAQERNMRGGTENVPGIIGLARALEVAHDRMEQDRKHILELKTLMISGLREKIEGVAFNGRSEDPENSLYTVLNVSLPPNEIHEMLLFKLDINGISASGGSACASGSNVGSHVLTALNTDPEKGAIRFSFSRYNNKEEVNYVVDKLAEIVNTR